MQYPVTKAELRHARQFEPQDIAEPPAIPHSDQQEVPQTPLTARMEPFSYVQATQNSYAVGDMSPELHRHSQPNLSAQISSPEESRLEALLSAARQLGTPAEVPWRSPSPPQTRMEPVSVLDREGPVTIQQPIEATTDLLSFSAQGHMSSLDQWAFELVQSDHPMPNRTPADALQTWLFPLDAELSNGNDPQSAIDDGQLQSESMRPPDPNHGSPSESIASFASKIPKERFARVESCWPSKHRTSSRLMPTLWRDLASCETTNLLTDSSSGLPERVPTARERRNSRWGLDDECRDALHQQLNAAPSPWKSDTVTDTASSASEVAVSPAPDGIQFPPAEILDIALEMYLRYFHPTLPIIHIPTFSAKNAARPLLLSMCLIGLSILGTTGALKFVAKSFSVRKSSRIRSRYRTRLTLLDSTAACVERCADAQEQQRGSCKAYAYYGFRPASREPCFNHRGKLL